MWEGNKSQAGSLESIILDGAKRILGCLQSHRDRAKLKWWYKLAPLPEEVPKAAV